MTNTISMTLESGKKTRLEPIKQERFMSYSKTKAGCNGKKTKTNQDAILIDTKLPHGLKVFCICDGHGLNGHHVSDFIRSELVSTDCIKLLKRKSNKAVEKDA
jgi:serine/threonine protein phosphatase PrpC